MMAAVDTPFDGVLKQLRDVASSIDACASMGLPDFNMPRMQADSTASILASLERLRSFGAPEQAAFLTELHPLVATYGDANAARLATKVNDMCKAPPRGGARTGLRAMHGKEFGKPQAILCLLKYLTRKDWEIIRSRASYTYKLHVISSRLKRWGVKTVSEESRRSPVALLLSQHFGLENVGTAQCRYRKLYDISHEFKQHVDNALTPVDVPGPRIDTYPDDPNESDVLSDELIQFAADGDELCSVDLEDYATCMQHVPLRETFKLLIMEDKALNVPTIPLPSPARAGVEPRAVLDWPAERLLEDAMPIGSWKPANNYPALTDPDWENRMRDQRHHNGALARQPTFRINSLRPSRRGPAEAHTDQNNTCDTWGNTWAAAPYKRSDTWGECDKWGHSGTDDGSWWQRYDQAAWDAAERPRGAAPTAAGAATEADGKNNVRPSVADYERQVLQDLTKQREAAKLRKRPAAAEAASKGGRARAAAGARADARVPRDDDGWAQELEKKHPVNVKEICTKVVANSCTRDAFTRRGYDLGVKIGRAKGLDAEECAALGKAGYRKAKEYLQSIGVTPKIVAAAGKGRPKAAAAGKVIAKAKGRKCAMKRGKK